MCPGLLAIWCSLTAHQTAAGGRGLSLAAREHRVPHHGRQDRLHEPLPASKQGLPASRYVSYLLHMMHGQISQSPSSAFFPRTVTLLEVMVQVTLLVICCTRILDILPAAASEAPPLLVKIHGGPTAAASTAFSLGIQFWTSRGVPIHSLSICHTELYICFVYSNRSKLENKTD